MRYGSSPLSQGSPLSVTEMMNFSGNSDLLTYWLDSDLIPRLLENFEKWENFMTILLSLKNNHTSSILHFDPQLLSQWFRVLFRWCHQWSSFRRFSSFENSSGSNSARDSTVPSHSSNNQKLTSRKDISDCSNDLISKSR